MKVLITGAHFTPAQAVIEELKKETDVEIVYVGRKYTREGDKSPSVESEVLPKLNVKFIPITAGRLQRSFTIYTVPSLFKIPLGILQSFYVLLTEKPDVVLSFGGYVSVPVVISAWSLSIPIITHEQTLVSGLANTVNSWFADKVAVSFKGHSANQSPKLILTGNPMRREIFGSEISDSEIKKLVSVSQKEKLPLILITGGNQGSHVINLAVSEILDELNGMACVIHQTGDSKFNDFASLTQKRQSLKYPERYLVKKWVLGSDFGGLLKKVDLALARAGANTLLEFAYAGVPALVIPIPYLYKNEQTVNAGYFEKLGLVKPLPQKELNPENLLVSLKEMLSSLPLLKDKAKGAKSVVIPDAAKRLAMSALLLGKINNL